MTLSEVGYSHPLYSHQPESLHNVRYLYRDIISFRKSDVIMMVISFNFYIRFALVVIRDSHTSAASSLKSFEMLTKAGMIQLASSSFVEKKSSVALYAT